MTYKKMEDNLKKMKMEDDLNFKAVLLSWFNNKNLKNKWFDTIEIDLVKQKNTLDWNINKSRSA